MIDKTSNFRLVRCVVKYRQSNPPILCPRERCEMKIELLRFMNNNIPIKCTDLPGYTSEILSSRTLALSIGLLVAGTRVIRTSVPFASSTSLIPRQ